MEQKSIINVKVGQRTYEQIVKAKALLRKAKERTVDKLWDRIGVILDEFSPPECSNYFRHDGYGSG